jgi:hypothetical protein
MKHYMIAVAGTGYLDDVTDKIDIRDFNLYKNIFSYILEEE